MKKLLFKKEMAELIKLGIKTETRRVHKPNLKINDTFYVAKNYFKLWKIPDILVCKVLDIKEELLQSITEDSVKKEGFKDKESFLNYFYEINKKRLDTNTNYSVFVISFTLQE